MYERADLRHTTSAGWQSGIGLDVERQDAPVLRQDRPGYIRVPVKVTVLRIVRGRAPLVWRSATAPRAALPDRYEVIRRHLGYEVAAEAPAREVQS